MKNMPNPISIVALFTMQQGDTGRAINDFSKAIEVAPSNAVAYGCRGFIYSSKGEYNLAIEDLNMVIKT